jgi:hypothetical protein
MSLRTIARLFFTLISVLFFLDSFGQLAQPQRLEIIMEKEDKEDFNVVSADEEGLILYREVRNRETRMEHKYQVILVDTALNRIWESNYYIHLKYVQIGFEYTDNYFYLLFQRNIESLKADLFVMRIDLESRRSETFLIERDYAIELTDFEVVGNTLVFGGYTNGLPTFITYKFGKPQALVLPGFINERSQILHLETNDELKQLNVLVSYRSRDKRKSISFKSFNEEGELIKNINLEPSDEKSLLFGRVMNLDTNVDLIAGTYTRKRSELSRGIFLARIDPTGDQVINYYNYADLKNFFSYMKARRQKRVEERIKRRKIKGKKNKFHYHLLVHEVVPWQGRFIMVGEAFYPKYSQSSYYGGYSPYSYGTSYGQAFDGYKYTHAVVFGFDRRGRLIWDNSFEIDDITSYTLDQFVHVSISEEEMALLYMYENEIRAKIIEGNEVIEGKTFNELALSFENDIVEQDENEYGGLEKWYGGKLFAYGIQKIKNTKAGDVRSEREVFFINKIEYR